MPATLPWLRLWERTLDCPKIQRLSGEEFKAWVNLLLLASRQKDRGTLPPMEEIAYGIRRTPKRAAKVVEQLIELRLIDRDGDQLAIHDWSDWQRESDSCAERQRRHRERNRIVRGLSDSDVAALKAMPYEEYLTTPHWLAVRQLALEAARWRCQVCNSPDGLDVHHRTYERRGRERRDDVITLCRTCHDIFHTHGKLAV